METKPTYEELEREVDALRKTVSEDEYLEQVYHSIGQSFIILDPDQNILFANLATEKITGLSSNELKGKKCYQVFHYPRSTSPPESCPMQKALSTGKVETMEMEVETASGTFLISCTPVFDHNSKLKRIIHISTDITEIIEMKEQLRQAYKMEAIGTLAGGLAHEFNNILGIIIGNTELAIDDVPEWNPVNDYLEEIRQASLRATDVVRQILRFARKSTAERMPIPIKSIIKSSLKLLFASLPSFIEMRQDLSCEYGTVMADHTQINQILVNICTNSAYAMREEGGVLDVKLEDVVLNEETVAKYEDLSPGNHVKLTVQDTGHGIKPEIIDRIFDPYFTTKGVGEGTGMGLSVVHGIVKSHDGAITVNSELGKGTVVEVLFPLIEAEIEPEVVEPDDLPTGDEKILFVDDEKSIVSMSKQRLERLGYQVEAKTNPDEALELFRSKPDKFDLIISDMTMPQMTGDKLAQKLMEIRPDIPIIISTGFSEKMDEDKASAMGIRAFVLKPLIMRTLALTVRKVLDEK